MVRFGMGSECREFVRVRLLKKDSAGRIYRT